VPGDTPTLRSGTTRRVPESCIRVPIQCGDLFPAEGDLIGHTAQNGIRPGKYKTRCITLQCQNGQSCFRKRQRVHSDAAAKVSHGFCAGGSDLLRVVCRNDRRSSLRKGLWCEEQVSRVGIAKPGSMTGFRDGESGRRDPWFEPPLSEREDPRRNVTGQGSDFLQKLSPVSRNEKFRCFFRYGCR
jgi:hypothetical protein